MNLCQSMAQTTEQRERLRRIADDLKKDIDNFDLAVIAIQIGDLESFCEMYPQIMRRADELLPLAAAHPGVSGTKMIMRILADTKEISYDAYLSACQRAVELNDLVRVQLLVNQAETVVNGLDQSFYGTVIKFAYYEHPHIAQALLDGGTPEQIASAPAVLFYQAAANNDSAAVNQMMEKTLIVLVDLWKEMKQTNTEDGLAMRGF